MPADEAGTRASTDSEWEVTTMLMRTDPFQQLDRLMQQVAGTAARPAMMPMDAWREGQEFVVQFDLPGVDPNGIDLTVERNVLSVHAERRRTAGEGVELAISERPVGVFTRQLFLGDTLDAGKLTANYDAGVLTLRIPVAEQAKPRKISVGSSGAGGKEITGEVKES
jgi:HSP20 family protein